MIQLSAGLEMQESEPRLAIKDDPKYPHGKMMLGSTLGDQISRCHGLFRSFGMV